MATCARCGEYLSDQHRCHGRATILAGWAADLAVGTFLGGVLGLLVFGEMSALLLGRSFPEMGIFVGALVTITVMRAMRLRAGFPGHRKLL